MATLKLEGITKRFGSVTVVEDVDLEVPSGAFVCFLGPSGCGKTTLLRLIAGLEAASAGRILIDGAEVTQVPTHRREIGMVFQSLALFPHLTVGQNIAYGLRIRGVDRQTQQARVEELLALVQLPGLAERQVFQLSGGQRQRVAIARALALEPKIFLLDEPLSALDAKLREAMQVELRLLQQRLGITTILVTHDQREAMTMSDLVAVMGHGHIQQFAPPLEIYREPATAFVADFIGSTNMLDGTLRDGAVVSGAATLPVARLPAGLGEGDSVQLSIRPEELHLFAAEDDAVNAAGAEAGGRIPGSVAFIRDVGAAVEIHMDCGCGRLVAVTSPKDRPDVREGSSVVAVLPPEACRVLAR